MKKTKNKLINQFKNELQNEKVKSLNYSTKNNNDLRAPLNAIIGFSDSLLHFETMKILLAEDNIVNVMVAKIFLEKIGITNIDVAADGKECLENWQKNSYDLILMDFQMPNMDGYEATEKIRELEKQSSDKPVIIIGLSASNTKKEIDRCYQCGMNAFLSKPFDKDKLSMLLVEYFKA